MSNNDDSVLGRSIRAYFERRNAERSVAAAAEAAATVSSSVAPDHQISGAAAAAAAAAGAGAGPSNPVPNTSAAVPNTSAVPEREEGEILLLPGEIKGNGKVRPILQDRLYLRVCHFVMFLQECHP